MASDPGPEVRTQYLFEVARRRASEVCVFCAAERWPAGCGPDGASLGFVHHHEGADGTECTPCVALEQYSAVVRITSNPIWHGRELMEGRVGE